MALIHTRPQNTHFAFLFLQRLVRCLEYLRERIGVPRDMSGPAAIALRAQLNWAIRLIK